MCSSDLFGASSSGDTVTAAAASAAAAPPNLKAAVDPIKHDRAGDGDPKKAATASQPATAEALKRGKKRKHGEVDPTPKRLKFGAGGAALNRRPN